MSDSNALYGYIVPNDAKRTDIRGMGLDVWRCNMILQLKDSMLKLLFDEIDKQRQTNTSSDIISGIIESFVEVCGTKEKNSLKVSIYVYFDKIRKYS